MTDKSPYAPPPDEGAPVRPPAGLRRWFLAGFALVFVGVLVFMKQFAWHPSGQALILCPLWQYYLIECRRAFMPTMLGPMSGGGSAAVVVFVEHLVISVLGGTVSLGAGVVVRWLRR